MKHISAVVFSFDSYEEKISVQNALSEVYRKANVMFSDADDCPYWTIFDIISRTPVRVDSNS